MTKTTMGPSWAKLALLALLMGLAVWSCSDDATEPAARTGTRAQALSHDGSAGGPSGNVIPPPDFVLEWGSFGTGDGQFENARSIDVDATSVFVADLSDRVQKFTKDGTFVGSWGETGTGDGQFQFANGVAVKCAPGGSHLYVADNLNERVHKFAVLPETEPCPPLTTEIPASGQRVCLVTVWGSRGSGDGFFAGPNGLALTSAGEVYVTESINHRIQKFVHVPIADSCPASTTEVAANGAEKTCFVTKWGTFGSGPGEFAFARNLDVVPLTGNLLVADAFNHRIQKFDPDGAFLLEWGHLGSGLGEMNEPLDVELDPASRAYVVDSSNHRIQVFERDGTFLTTFGSAGTGPGELQFPWSMAIDEAGTIFVADSHNNRVQVFEFADGPLPLPPPELAFTIGEPGSGPGQLDEPLAVAADLSTNVYVADRSSRVQRFTGGGELLTSWGSPGTGPGEFDSSQGLFLAASRLANVLVADVANDRVQKLDPDGGFLLEWGQSGAGPGEFVLPRGVAASVLTGSLYVLDSGNARVQQFDAAGAFVLEWGGPGSGPGELQTPAGIAVDPRTDEVYIGDAGNHRIQRFTGDGQLLGAWGTAGSQQGQFDVIEDVAVDNAGNVHVADSGTARVQIFDAAGELQATFDGFGPGGPNGVTVDRAGSIYVTDPSADEVRVFRLDAPIFGEVAVDIAAGATVDLPAGAYSSITVGDEAEVQLLGGTYEVGTVSFGSKSEVTALATTEFLVAEQFSADDKAHLRPADGLDDGELRVAVMGGDGTTGDPTASCFVLGEKVKLDGLVYVPNGTALLGEKVKVRGAVEAQEIQLGSKATITETADIAAWLPGFLDDLNGCVTDACSALNTECVEFYDPHCAVFAATQVVSPFATSVETLCQVRQINTGQPCSDGEACTVDDTCDGATGLCTGTLLPDGVPCPGDVGEPCTTDDDCEEPGLVCGTENGYHFGRSATESVCWPAQCDIDPFIAGCGFPGAPCGQCEPKEPCFADSDCDAGEVCGAGVGLLFDSPGAPNACWPAECEDDQVATGCGDYTSPCGTCLCTPACEGKACGDDPADGCGGLCTGLCDDKEPGCTRDSDCQPGSICGIGAGARLGLPADQNVCLPASCFDHDVNRIDCGPIDSTCGLCPPCVPACDGRACGPDPVCGVDCGPACGSGQFCSADGQCAPTVVLEPLEVPDGMGGTKEVFPLELPESNGVGALAGAFSVTDRGAATYAVPLIAPPGHAAATPQLALRYTSSKKNGFLGVGWNLDGLSMITRCPRTFAHDGMSVPVQHASNDRFCLDGQRLVVVNGGTYGAPGTEYRTEIDTFSRVMLNGGTPLTGPDSFTVFAKDGRILTYGGAGRADALAYADFPSSIVRAWALSSVSDRSGNTMTVRYENHTLTQAMCDELEIVPAERCGTVEFLPSSITYGGNLLVSREGDREIRFFYSEDRDDRLEGYGHGGVRVQRTRRLDTVETSVGGELVRRYILTYPPTPGPSGNSRIAAITECGFDDDGPVCKPPTSFTYRDEQGFGPPIATGLTPFTHGNGDVTRAAAGGYGEILLDVNGDGLTDLMIPKVVDSVARWILYVATGDLSSPFDVIDPDLLIRAACLRPSSVFDANGDGRDDLFDHCLSPTGEYRLLVSTGNGFTSEVALSSSAPVNPDIPFLLDVDGDGQKDIVECWFDINGKDVPNRFEYYRNFGGVFDPTPIALPQFGSCSKKIAGNRRANRLLADVDGDGLPNLLRYDFDEEHWAALFTTYDAPPFWEPRLETSKAAARFGRVQQIDLNGDGLLDTLEHDPFIDFTLPDVGVVSRHGHVAARINTSLSYPFVGNQERQTAETFSQNRPIDFDGDGFQDLIRNSDSVAPVEGGSPSLLDPTREWRLLTGSAAGLSAGTCDSSGCTDALDPPGQHFLPGFANNPLSPSPEAIWMLADIDGDSNRDLLLIDATGELLIYPGTGQRTDLLVQIIDGLGHRIDIDYEPTVTDLETGEPVRTYVPGPADSSIPANCQWPLQCNRRTEPLVSGHTEGRETSSPPGVNLERRFTYRYFDRKSDRRGRGTLGFGSRIIVEADGAGELLRATELDFDNDSIEFPSGIYLFAGRVTRSLTRTPFAEAGLNTEKSARVETRTIDWEMQISDAGVLFPYPETDTFVVREQLESGLSVELFTTAVSRSTDAYGNFTSIDTLTGRTDPVPFTPFETAQITRDFTPTPEERDAWLIGLLKAETITSARNGGIQTFRNEFLYDALGRLSQAVREPQDTANQLLTDIQRDFFGNPRVITNSDAFVDTRATEIVYADNGIYPTHVIDSPGVLGLVTQLSFDQRHGTIDGLADPNGIVTQSSYDVFGRISQVVAPDGSSTTSYQPGTIPDATMSVFTSVFGGPQQRVQFDGLGRTIQIDVSSYVPVPDGTPDKTTVRQELTYDSAGRVETIARPHLPADTSQGIVQYNYDARQRLISAQFPDGAVVQLAHGAAGLLQPPADAWILQPEAVQVTQTIDPRVNRDTMVVDHTGSPVANIDALGTVTEYEYGPFASLQRIVDAGNNTTLLERDRLGRVERLVDPDAGETLNTYNAFDELKTLTRNGRLSDYDYDVLGRLRFLTTPDGIYEWIYDNAGGPNELGRLVRTIHPDGNQTRLHYEPGSFLANRGLLEAVERTIDGQTLSTNLTYDIFSRLLSVEYPTSGADPFIVRYDYDNVGNVIAAVRDHADPTPDEELWAFVDHDQGYRIKTERFGNGIERERSYEPLTGRISNITARNGATVLRSLGYTYDLAGNVTSRTGLQGLFTSETYTYDPLDRLATVTTGSLTASYAYDELGNLIEKPGFGTYLYDMDDKPHFVRSVGSNIYTPDADGNQMVREGPDIPGGYQELVYDFFGQPTSVTTGNDASAVTTNLEYDNDGLRVAKRDDTGTTLFADDLYERFLPVAAGDNTHRFRIYVNGEQVAELTETESGGSVTGTTTRYLTNDLLGSPVLLTDETGALVATQDFDPFGASSSPTSETVSGFTGHRPDAGLGLVNAGFRSYDPVLGKFIQPDPIIANPFSSQGRNPYSYVSNNPLSFVDPLGLQTEGLDQCPGGRCGDTNTSVQEIPPDPLEDPRGASALRDIGQGAEQNAAINPSTGLPAPPMPGLFPADFAQIAGDDFTQREAPIDQGGRPRTPSFGLSTVICRGSRLFCALVGDVSPFVGGIGAATRLPTLIRLGGTLASQASTRLTLALRVRKALQSRKFSVRLEGAVAQRFRNVLVSFRRDVFTGKGKEKLTDIDVELTNVIIEVTTGRGTGKTRQVTRLLTPLANPTGKKVIVFGKRLGPNVQKSIRKAGGFVATTVKELDRLVSML